jgi:hypothetical protein
MKNIRGYVGLGQLFVAVALPATGLLFAKDAAAAATIVACIGEQSTSTTEFAYNGHPELEWPGVLQTLLGSSYTVGNDVIVNGVGSNGNTVTAGNCVTAASLAGPPGIVVIGPFAEHDYAAGLTLATWQADYQKVVDKYLALTPAPKVYVMTPPPATFTYQSAAEQTFAATIVDPAVKNVAAATAGVKVIDLFPDNLLATNPGYDGKFTVAESAEVAKLAYEAITGMTPGDGGGGSGASTGSASGASSGTASGASSGTASGTSSGASTSGAGGSGTVTGGTGASGTVTGGTGSASGTGASGTVTSSAGSTSSGAAASGTVTGGSGSTSSGTVTGGSGSSSSGTVTGGSGTNNGSAGTSTNPGGGGTPSNSSGCTMGVGSTAGGAGSLLALFGLTLFASRRRTGRRQA